MNKIYTLGVGMRCRCILLTVLAVLTAAGFVGFPTFAKHVSPEEAMARLSGRKLPSRVKAIDSGMRLAATLDNVYVFSSTNGFMVLPSDDVAPALLGYSDEGRYVKGENPQLDYWLDFYSSRIEYALSMKTESAGHAPARRAAEARAEIQPLVMTEWNQEAPYNDLCPKVDGHKTVTGCVATAMSQVIRTHEYPSRPVGKNSYEWRVNYRSFEVDSLLSYDYDAVTFDFERMPYIYDSSSTDEERHAVAELMLACGMSVDMHYDIGDSGASTMKMGTALIEHFKYDKSIWMPVRNYYGLEEWEDLIYADLEKGLPVLYSGVGTAGGHQFICDGYAGDGYFHFNWGWGGMSNGYFLLDALNPGSLGVGGGAGGFNFNQQITLNVTPEQEDSKYTYLVYCNNFTAKEDTATEGKEIVFGGQYYNYSLHALPAGTYYGLEIVSASGDTIRQEGTETLRLGPLYGQDGFSVKWPKLADGVYTVYPALKDEYGRWSIIHTPLDGKGPYTATVTDGIARLTREAVPEVEASDLSLNSRLYVDSPCSVSFTVTNDGDAEYIWKVAPALLDESGNVVATAPELEVDLQGGDSRTIDGYVTRFEPVSKSASDKLTAGTYTLTIINSTNKAEITPENRRLTVTMEEKPADTRIEVSDFTVNGGDDVIKGSKAEFRFKLTCKEGFVDEVVHVYIFKNGYGYDVMSHTFQAPLISAGESIEESAEIDLSSLEEGRYSAIVYYGHSFEGVPTYFDIKADTPLSVQGTEADNADDAPIYDLSGRRLPEAPYGVPVIKGGKLIILRR